MALTRRTLLGRGAAGILSASFLAELAACGGDELGKGRSAADAPAVEKEAIADTLAFSNWPFYIDEDQRTLDRFRREYDTSVKYTEEINDNQEFFGKVQQQYAQGDSGGRDLHVVSDWMAAKMMRLGFTVRWQSGMPGLIYRSDRVKREPRSMEDLFDPDYKGKVTLLTEMYDTVPMVLLGEGGDPATASTDELLEAVEKIDRESRSGQVRRFTGNEYTRDLAKGDSWIALGWSGDALQLQASNPDVRFARPEEGFLLWADNMQIPVGAPHAYTAQKFMDFVYRPEVQLAITEWIQYVCPAKGVQGLLEKRDPELAANALVFPTEDSLTGATDLRPLDPDEERELEAAFQRAIGA